MIATDAQVRKLMDEMLKHGKVGKAAMMANLTRTTGRKYVAVGQLPSELKEARYWRTRDDPFEADWPEIRSRLSDAPELEAKTLFEGLLANAPEKYSPGQLRTLQRHVREWCTGSRSPRGFVPR